MSLLDQMTSPFVIMEKHREPDGEGGYNTRWYEGASIALAVQFDQSIEAMTAQAEGVTSVYTFLAPINCGLEYHDVVKRVSDGQCFRITSPSGEKITPPSSTMRLTAVTAERWELPQ